VWAISVAPPGARFLFCFFFPWLSPWATFCRRYAACLGVTSPALYSSTVSRLRRPFPSDRFFLVMVRPLKRRRFPLPGDGPE